MATWEVGTRSLLRSPAHRPALVAAAQAALAAGVVALAGAGPYWGLRTSLEESQARAATRVLEVSPTLRPSPPAVQVRADAGPAGRVSSARPAAARVVFGRFARRQDAEARARAVRRKGYIASVVRVGAGYLVVSRPYPTVEAARFWAEIFSEIGLRADILPRVEALAAAGES
ncbi:MAG: hypothetical protein QN210_08400 [Armatimonadota bacterium]|nr:hypothetical protein [Armatimonadota bacterium]MDR7515948.1 hypothetical protein [Armatimonadota bacterium]MDR7561828.1 hypothetical protein [Armatimonadota bacterium]MDR7587026.1 hypothetical protein [Armatimonadota bacterium]MDR7612417.1 hypothetical protein [Armatimonadota bacterium]